MTKLYLWEVCSRENSCTSCSVKLCTIKPHNLQKIPWPDHTFKDMEVQRFHSGPFDASYSLSNSPLPRQAWYISSLQKSFCTQLVLCLFWWMIHFSNFYLGSQKLIWWPNEHCKCKIVSQSDFFPPSVRSHKVNCINKICSCFFFTFQVGSNISKLRGNFFVTQ